MTSIDAARRAGARFSVTAHHTPAVTRAITAIAEHAWVPIHYPTPSGMTTSSAGFPTPRSAETTFTAFTGRRAAEHITARLIVRRVRRLNPATAPAAQSELFTAYRYHAVCTDNPSRCSTLRHPP